MDLSSLRDFPKCIEIIKTLSRIYAETRTVISNVCMVTLLGGNRLYCNQIIWYSCLIDWFIETESVIAAILLSSEKILVFK